MALQGSVNIVGGCCGTSNRSGSYQKALKEACPGREVIAVSCPDFVPLIESGHIDPKDPLLRDAVARYLQPVREIRAEALLLGCTHYGIIEAAVREFLGPEITLVSAAESGAAALCSRLLKEKQTGGSGKTVYYTSGKAEDFSEAAALFLGCEKTEIRAEAIPPQPVPET